MSDLQNTALRGIRRRIKAVNGGEGGYVFVVIRTKVNQSIVVSLTKKFLRRFAEEEEEAIRGSIAVHIRVRPSLY